MAAQTRDITAGQVETRILDGAIVNFGPGAEVLSIKHPSDYSAIRFSCYGPRGTASEIAKYMFYCFQEPVGISRIHVLTESDISPVVAHVQVKDPAFAARIKSRFDRYSKLTKQANIIIRRVAVEIGYELSSDVPEVPGLKLCLLQDRLAMLRMECPILSECAVCLAEAEEPFVTPCGHRYCRACFIAQCSSITNNKKQEIPIRCLGDSGRCARIFLLTELEYLLEPTGFEQILSKSATLHLQNLTTYRPCPTRDCDQTYRTTTDGSVLSCLECCVPICTSCYTPSHNGVTCATNQKAGMKEYEKWWFDNKNINRCPKCRNLVEKIGGCDRMECGCCWAGFCWMCMEVWDEGGRCRCERERAVGIAWKK